MTVSDISNSLDKIHKKKIVNNSIIQSIVSLNTLTGETQDTELEELISIDQITP